MLQQQLDHSLNSEKSSLLSRKVNPILILESGEVPSIFKESILLPIHKSAAKSALGNWIF